MSLYDPKIGLCSDFFIDTTFLGQNRKYVDFRPIKTQKVVSKVVSNLVNPDCINYYII